MNNSDLLHELSKSVSQCKRCPLYKTAIHAVPGEGNSKTKIMFVGEAPGRFEDESGRPFIGRAGKLLTELLVSIGIDRNDVFITSVIKHRPPKNRFPKPDEIKTCSFWLEKQLTIINPQIIVTLGKLALDYFLVNKKISLVHGTINQEKGRIIFPVYHPAAGLRSTRNKNKLFEDFQKLSQVLNKI
ncbi:MAG: Phage SPO1 DNA polymerase-related protein [Candidatus Gottesmanbacteria bacterium GW2011_GWA2_41_12]|uniref:Type-4 uracil-DNA glycosylase n=1 Tax=Candidatus Gottesmanbacteria bacterium GW2011_GWA2_41_12 TaxID=1618440 RepID=A0A0G0UI99_9BACT|nr:MAG: Phage SPO1 DNA polymerase-related protein [Candidatus Gottesmanbacteria bacterium GW2011_GWA2_41_12]